MVGWRSAGLREGSPVFSSTARLTGWRLAGVIAAVGAFVVASAGTGWAETFGTPYQIGLDPTTPLPITAADFKTTGSCDGLVPPYLDGWHFVVPGGSTVIVSLDLVFIGPIPFPVPSSITTLSPGPRILTIAPDPSLTPTATGSGSPSPFGVVYTMDRMGAFVATLPGAQLVSAAAIVVTVTGQPMAQFLELANTCPAGTATSLPTGFPTFTASPDGTFSPLSSSLLPTGQGTPIPATVPVVGTGAAPGAADQDVSALPTCSPSSPATSSPTVTPTTTAGATPTHTPTTTATATPTTTVSATPTVTVSATPTPSASPSSTCAAAPAPNPVSGNLSVTG